MIHALKRLVSAKVKQKKDVFHLAQRFTRFLNYHVTENLSCDKNRSCDESFHLTDHVTKHVTLHVTKSARK